jgi:hypothetical protein
MVKVRLPWVNVGMAVSVPLGIAFVALGRNSEYFVPMLWIYIGVLAIWAFVAEVAVIRAEAAEREDL